MAASVRVKAVLFSVFDNKLHIFLPALRLPQKTVTHGLSLNGIAKNLIEEIIGVEVEEGYLEQLYTFSHPFEEGMEIDIAYFYLLPSSQVTDKYREAWLEVIALPRNLSEHGIISYALKRLRWKVEYTNLAYSLLPREFTLSELQLIYEAIIGKKLDKRNFRKKILSLKLVKKSGRQRTGVKARPAQLYKFIKRAPVIVKVF